MEYKKSLGQNFLQDHNILRKEANLVDIKNKIALEIGPGDGRLTEKLLANNPAKLLVIEKDMRFAEMLKEKFINTVVDISNVDFLDYNLPKVDVIFGNIPYNISSKIIFKLKDYDFEIAVLMVQKEFAQKMVAKPNDSNYGRLSVTSQLFFEVTYIQVVPRHLFVPKPKVDSALILLKPTGVKITQKEEDFLRILFSQKNKTIKAIFRKSNVNLPVDFLQRRPRTLSKDEVIILLKAF